MLYTNTPKPHWIVGTKCV